MAGRPPKPTWLKSVQGTARPCRENGLEPMPDVELPPPPDWLGDAARAHYLQLAATLFELGAITALDRDMLALYCDMYTDIAERRRRRAGVKAAEVAQLRQLAGSLGLDPANRSRLRVTKTPDMFGGDDAAAWDALA